MRLSNAFTAACLLACTIPAMASTVYVGVISFNQLIPGAPGAPGVNAFDIQNITGVYALPPDLPVISDVTFTSAFLQLFQGSTIYDTLVLGDIGPGPLLNPFGDILVQLPDDLQFTSARLLATLSFTTLLLDGGGTVFVSPVVDVMLLPSSGMSLTPGDTVAITVETVDPSGVPEPGSAWLLLIGAGLLAIKRFRRKEALATVALALAVLPVSAQNLLWLHPTSSPTAGIPGVTIMSVTASGFPLSGVAVSQTTVLLRPSLAVGPAMTATTLGLNLVAGSTCRVNFRFNGPNVTAPTAYEITIVGPGLASTNSARMIVNPVPTVTAFPASATAGSNVTVAIVGQATGFVNGSTRANFGPGISVGGSPAGTLGLLSVTSPTSATAQISVAANAPPGPRTITVATGAQQASTAFQVTDPSNNAPRITSTPVATATMQQPYTYTVTAIDPDNDPITFALTAAPTGMTIGPSSGVISWTPAASGNFNVTVQARDGRGGTASQGFSINVAGVTTTEPLLKFSFTDPPRVQALSSPLVVDLDRDGIGDIVLAVVGPSIHALYAIDGRTGSVKWRVDGNYTLLAGQEMTAGDIDGDGFPEILVLINDGSNPRRRIRAYNHDGTVKWVSGDIVDGVRVTQSSGPRRLVLANITGDSKPEIVFGHTGKTGDMLPTQFAESLVSVFNNLGQPVFTTRVGRFNGGADTITVADLDMDGAAEILYGGAAVSSQGNLLWQYPGGVQVIDVAVANLDADPFPELVYLDRFGNLHCVEHTGARKWGPIQVPPSGSQGASHGLPVIGDADGNGTSEILIARGVSIYVYNASGVLERTIPLTHEGYGGNPTIFDLNGDGRPEIVYHSGRGPLDNAGQFQYGALFILDGVSGIELHRMFATRTSVGQYITPVIADVDGDGAAEIVVAGADQGGLLRVFKAISGNWSPARPVANQQEYSVTNVNDDGSIPASPAPNWLTPGLNNFRVYSKPGPPAQ